MTNMLFFFNDTATTEIYTLYIHDALPIFRQRPRLRVPDHEDGGARAARIPAARDRPPPRAVVGDPRVRSPGPGRQVRNARRRAHQASARPGGKADSLPARRGGPGWGSPPKR